MIESKKTTEEKPALKNVSLRVVKAEEDSVIVLVSGWRMRVYFEKNADKSKYASGQQIEVSYFGDLENPHEIKLQKIK